MNLPTSSLLFYTGLAVMALYFPLFFRTMARLPPEARALCVRQGSALRNVLGSLPLLAVFMVDDMALRAGLAALGLLMLVWEMRSQARRLRRAGLPEPLQARLQRIDAIALLGIVLMLGSTVMGR